MNQDAANVAELLAEIERLKIRTGDLEKETATLKTENEKLKEENQELKKENDFGHGLTPLHLIGRGGFGDVFLCV